MSNTDNVYADRIFLLEAALYQAISCIEFMHGCLTDESYKYSYPSMTENHLLEFRALLLPRPTPCLHSSLSPECESCQHLAAYHHRLAKLRDRYNIDWNQPDWRRRLGAANLVDYIKSEVNQ